MIKKKLTSGKTTYSFTCDVNPTTPRRRTLERLSNPTLIQDVQFCQETHFNLFLQDDTIVVVFRKRKTHLMGPTARIFDLPLTSYES